MLDLILSLIAPHICYGCGETGSILCDRCKHDLNDDDFGRCLWCLKPSAHSNQCAQCAALYGVQAVWVVGEREGLLKTITDNYKFESMREGANQIADLLDHVVPLLPANTIVTHVPTTPAHIRQRGFDHACRLASRFASQRKLIHALLMSRVKQSSQHELSRQQRYKEAERSFAPLTHSIDAPVLLIDDVLTTGATIRACVRHLQAAGAPAIYVAIVARQMPDENQEAQ